MKAPVLGLAIAVTAFAGSSLYLWLQLKEERAQASRVEETNRQLHARIAELEKARVLFAQDRPPGMDSPLAPPSAPTPGITPQAVDEITAELQAEWAARTAAGPSPAMIKMMRAGSRAEIRRQYGEFVRGLGLSKEMTSKLLDLLTDQQVADFTPPPNVTDEQQFRRNFEERHRANEAAIADLIGSDKAAELKSYQQSIPSRQEFEMLARQLDGSDAPLTAEQHDRLLAVWLEERAREPQPNFSMNSTEADYVQASNAWSDEFAQRFRSEARHILDSEQLGAYDEIQNAQREMRDQNGGFSAVAMPLEAGMMGNVVFSGTIVSAPAPVPPPEPVKDTQ